MLPGGSAPIRRWRALLAAALLLGSLPGVGGTEPVEVPPTPPPTHGALPLGIPMAELPEAARAPVEAVLSRSILAQRVAGIRFRSREAVFDFLLDHPDFAASVARALHLGHYRVTAIEDDTYWGDDRRGAEGVIRVLYADPGRRLYHLEGQYDPGRFLPTIRGQLLILFEFRHESDAEGQSVVESSLTGHVRIDTPLVGAVAQAVGALSRPLVERAVDTKVRRFFRTVARVSRWAYDEPDGLAAALDGNPDVAQGPTLATFLETLLAGRPPVWAHGPYHLLPTALPDPVVPPDPAEP